MVSEVKSIYKSLWSNKYMEVSLYICYEFTVAQKCSRLSKSNMHDFWARKKFLMHYILI